MKCSAHPLQAFTINCLPPAVKKTTGLTQALNNSKTAPQAFIARPMGRCWLQIGFPIYVLWVGKKPSKWCLMMMMMIVNDVYLWLLDIVRLQYVIYIWSMVISICACDSDAMWYDYLDVSSWLRAKNLENWATGRLPHLDKHQPPTDAGYLVILAGNFMTNYRFLLCFGLCWDEPNVGWHLNTQWIQQLSFFFAYTLVI